MTRNALGVPLFAVAAILAIAGFATWSAFSRTDSVAGNSFTAGSVTISLGGTGSASFSAGTLAPGQSVSRCYRVAYTGTLDADVRFYVGGYAAETDALAPYLDVTILKGSGSASDCSDFTVAESPTLSSGTLAALAVARTTFGDGLAMTNLTDPVWSAGDATTYQVTVVQQDENAAQGRSATVDLVWEAQNHAAG